MRVRSTPLTQQLGVAGLVGNVFGQTTPSVTGVDGIGESEGDFAINVFFETRTAGFWFTPELLEFVDHAPGAEIRLDGVSKKWIRSETGEWKELDTAAERPPAKSWWRFWSR